jgi:hypothetical protein
METVLENFQANMELAFGDFVIRTKNVKFLAREKSVAFHPLICLGVQHGKMVVAKAAKSPWMTRFPFWESTSVCKLCNFRRTEQSTTLLCSPSPGGHSR